MKKLIASLMLVGGVCSAQLPSQVTPISGYPNIANPGTNYLFLLAQPGVTNWNTSVGQLTAYEQANLSFYTYTFDTGVFQTTTPSTYVTHIALLANSLGLTYLGSDVTTYIQSNSAAATTNAYVMVQASFVPQTQTNAFVATNALGGFLTNGTMILAQTTNGVAIANSNFTWIAVGQLTNQGKLFVSSNGLWFTK
jgi:hypothetical protein